MLGLGLRSISIRGLGGIHALFDLQNQDGNLIGLKLYHREVL